MSFRSHAPFPTNEIPALQQHVFDQRGEEANTIGASLRFSACELLVVLSFIVTLYNLGLTRYFDLLDDDKTSNEVPVKSSKHAR